MLNKLLIIAQRNVVCDFVTILNECAYFQCILFDEQAFVLLFNICDGGNRELRNKN